MSLDPRAKAFSPACGDRVDTKRLTLSPPCSAVLGPEDAPAGAPPPLSLPTTHLLRNGHSERRLSECLRNGHSERRLCVQADTPTIGMLPVALISSIASFLIVSASTAAPVLRRVGMGVADFVPAALDTVVDRTSASVDWDFFEANGLGGHTRPDGYQRRVLKQVRALRLVCSAWRDAIDYALVDVLLLNRASDTAPCWWPKRAGGRPTRAGEFIRTAPLPPDFGARFCGLRGLSLANLRMLFVPEALQQLTQLTQLNLSGNLLEELPPWFGHAFRLLELQLGDPWTGAWSTDSPAHSHLCRLGKWLSGAAPEDALPHTLRHLSLSDVKALTCLPKCVRHMRNLESLDLHSTECSIENDVYLAKLPGLKELVLLNSPSTAPNIPAYFSQLQCNAVVLSNEASYEHADDDAFASSVVRNLRQAFSPNSALALNLQILRLEDLQLEEIPTSFRALTSLSQLNLSGWSILHTLPPWLNELPLTKLLLNNCYGLRTNALGPFRKGLAKSLRELHLIFCTHLVGEPGVNLSGSTGLALIERTLGPLSDANPMLRFRVLSEIQTREAGVMLCLPAAEGFWNRAQGLDCAETAAAELTLAFCDVCNKPLRFGDWWHRPGKGFDLCGRDYHARQEHHPANQRQEQHAGAQQRLALQEPFEEEQLGDLSEFICVRAEQQLTEDPDEFREYLQASSIMQTVPAGQVLDDTLGDANANEQIHNGDGDGDGDGDDQVENGEAAHVLGMFASADEDEGEEEDDDDNHEGGAENGQDVLHAFDDHGDHTAMTWQAVFDAAGEDGEALVEAVAAEGEFEGDTDESLLDA
eukprot:COSAG05_NODE_1670_length_4305_cov_5.168093_1_plen_814_part_00